MALQKLFQKNPASIDNIKDHAKKAVGDHDYGVIGASLNIFHDLIMVIFFSSKFFAIQASHFFKKKCIRLTLLQLKVDFFLVFKLKMLPL